VRLGVYYENFGEPSVLVYGSLPDPMLGPGDVLVDVAAAGVNPVDLKRRAGLTAPILATFPVFTGIDVVGTVAAIGANVSGFPGAIGSFGCSFAAALGSGTAATRAAVPSVVSNRAHLDLLGAWVGIR